MVSLISQDVLCLSIQVKLDVLSNLKSKSKDNLRFMRPSCLRANTVKLNDTLFIMEYMMNGN